MWSTNLRSNFACFCEKLPISSQGLLDAMSSKAKQIHFVSLGCARNLIDSEVMVGLTTGAGYELTDDPAKANVIVVNTGGLVDAGKAESIDTILEMADYKETGSLETLLMTGCLAQ